VVTSPVPHPDGTLVQTAGYETGTDLYYAPVMLWDNIAEGGVVSSAVPAKLLTGHIGRRHGNYVLRGTKDSHALVYRVETSAGQLEGLCRSAGLLVPRTT
jgi:hypothetical protein